jgi:hypothetical protein
MQLDLNFFWHASCWFQNVCYSGTTSFFALDSSTAYLQGHFDMEKHKKVRATAVQCSYLVIKKSKAVPLHAMEAHGG